MNCQRKLYTCIKQGSVFKRTGYFTQGGAPESLAGWSIEMMLAEEKGDNLLSSNLAIGAGITIIDESSGFFKIDPIDTSAWPLGKVLFDLKFTKDGEPGHTQTIVIDVEESVT